MLNLEIGFIKMNFSRARGIAKNLCIIFDEKTLMHILPRRNRLKYVEG